jgi:predicted PurR-regulated permease PerM
VIAVLLLLLTGVILFAGPKLVDQFATLAKRIPAAVDEIRTSLSQYEWGQRLLESLGTASGSMPKGSELLGQVGGVFSTAAGAVSAVIVIFFTGIYLAADPYLYSRNLELLLPKRHRQRARELLESIGTALKWWLTGRFSSMAVVGILTSVGLWITGVPLAFPLGLLAAILSFVPFIGPIAWVIPASLVALAESPELIVWVLTVYLAVQLLESYVITPLIQQRAVRIPPALLIVMQILMTVLFGIMGTLFATPLAVTAIVIVQILYVEGVLGEDVSIMGDHRR